LLLPADSLERRRPRLGRRLRRHLKISARYGRLGIPGCGQGLGRQRLLLPADGLEWRRPRLGRRLWRHLKISARYGRLGIPGCGQGLGLRRLLLLADSLEWRRPWLGRRSRLSRSDAEPLRLCSRCPGCKRI
jgi:hypothetical protein